MGRGAGGVPRFEEIPLEQLGAQLKGVVVNNLMIRSNASKYLMHDKIISHEEIISKIDAVQLEDLESARLNILKSNITLSSIGPVQDLESLDSIKARFN